MRSLIKEQLFTEPYYWYDSLVVHKFQHPGTAFANQQFTACFKPHQRMEKVSALQALVFLKYNLCLMPACFGGQIGRVSGNGKPVQD